MVLNVDEHGLGKLNLCSYLDSVNDPDILQRRWLGGGGGVGYHALMRISRHCVLCIIYHACAQNSVGEISPWIYFLL